VPFSELTVTALYELLRLRAAVFVVEQRCPYQDLDGLDARAWHLTGHAGDELAAYARLLPPGAAWAEASVGRIVTAGAVRGRGYGRALVARALGELRGRLGDAPVRIGAQRYLETFYREFGFAVAGAPYDEDGIPHVPMLRPAGATP